MYRLDFSIQQNMGDEAVGAVEEDCLADSGVAHVGDYSMDGVGRKKQWGSGTVRNYRNKRGRVSGMMWWNMKESELYDE